VRTGARDDAQWFALAGEESAHRSPSPLLAVAE